MVPRRGATPAAERGDPPLETRDGARRRLRDFLDAFGTVGTVGTMVPVGFCASSSAKAVMDWLGYAAWRRAVFLCSLRSFMLR